MGFEYPTAFVLKKYCPTKTEPGTKYEFVVQVVDGQAQFTNDKDWVKARPAIYPDESIVSIWEKAMDSAREKQQIVEGHCKIVGPLGKQVYQGFVFAPLCDYDSKVFVLGLGFNEPNLKPNTSEWNLAISYFKAVACLLITQASELLLFHQLKSTGMEKFFDVFSKSVHSNSSRMVTSSAGAAAAASAASAATN